MDKHAQRELLHAELSRALHSARGRPTSRVRCPVCLLRTGKPDSRGALSLNVNTGRFKCFKCAVRGRLSRNFLSAHGASVELYDEAPSQSSQEVKAVSLPEGFTPLYEGEGWHAPAFAPARDYLERERGLDPSLWVAAGIGATLVGRFAHRVIVPVFEHTDSSSRVVGYVGRSLFKGARFKYLVAEGMDRRALLYNADALSVETDAPVFVVEGAFDALALWPDAVATLGEVSERQVELLCESMRPVVVVFDGDAWADSVSLAMRLRLHGVCAGAVQLGPGEDPDEVPREWLDERAAEALAASEVEL